MATNVSTASELQSAVDNASSGDTIVAAPGTYNLSGEVVLDTGNVTIKAENDAVVNSSNLSILDFSNASGGDGLEVNADGVTIRGFEIQNVPYTGINNRISSGTYANDTTVKRCDIHDCGGHGIQAPGNNHFYADVRSHFNGSQDVELYDGINAGNGDGHVFHRVWCYHNADDGWDMYDGTNYTMIHCKAFNNPGPLDGNPGGCTGFKLGITPTNDNVGSGGGGHYLERCVAWGHEINGFSYNNSEGPATTVVNCTAWDNDPYDFAFKKSAHELRNNLSINGTQFLDSNVIEENNSWNLGISNPQVKSLDKTKDGFLRLQSGSPCIDAGTTNVSSDVKYGGPAPDLGAFEKWKQVRTHTDPNDDATDWHIPFNETFADVQFDMTTLSKRLQSLREDTVTVPGLNKPNKGAADWHQPINANFANIETTVNKLATQATSSTSISLVQPAEGATGYDSDVDANFSAINTALSDIQSVIRDRE